MATFEELNKQYEELNKQQNKISVELNNLKYKWYESYIATGEVKNLLGRCFKLENQEVYYKIISPAPLRNGRVFVDTAENHFVCLATSSNGIETYVPESVDDIIPIWIEDKYILFNSSYFKDEEISPAQFDAIMENNIKKLKSFVNQKIIGGKTNPKAEMRFR